MSEQPNLDFIEYSKDACIIIEGERCTGEFFIIREGQVRLYRDTQVVSEEAGNVLGPGDMFGVVSAMAGRGSHIETAIALTDTALISVRKDQFSRLIRCNSQVATKIMLQFSKRMRYLNEAFTKITLSKGAGSADSEHLFTVAAYYEKQRRLGQARYAYEQYLQLCPKGKNAEAARLSLAEIVSDGNVPKIGFKTDGRLERVYPGKAAIFIEGEPGEEAFIIKSGSVKIAKVTENGEVVLAVLKPGDIFGEMALLDSAPRTASAIAREECRLAALNRANFNQVISTQPQMFARLTGMLAERIWLMYKQLANTKILDPVGRMYDMLLINLEKAYADLESVKSHQFDFGVEVLTGMVGLSPSDVPAMRQALQQNRFVEFAEAGMIRVNNVIEFSGQASYYRKTTLRSESARRRSRQVPPPPPGQLDTILQDIFDENG